MAINRHRFRGVVKKQLAKAGEFWLERQPAKLGDFAGTVIVPNTESMVYARLINGQLLQVYNNVAPNIPHLDVLIGRDKSQPAVWKVIETRLVHNTTQIPSYITFHHKQHEYPAPDTVFVRRDQITPLLVLPAGGFNIRLFGDVITRAGGTVIRVQNQDIDLSAWQAGTGEAYWVVLEVDEDGNLNYIQGDSVASFALLEFAPIPASTPGSMPICAFAFYDGQTELRRDDDERTIVDLRQFTSEVVSDSVTQFHEADEKVTIHEDDEVFGADSENSFSATKWLWSTVQAWIIDFADLLYAAVGHTHAIEDLTGGTQYRQFVYEVSGGDFSFVIDEDGNPIMALEDLE